jgi:hypothetical protein
MRQWLRSQRDTQRCGRCGAAIPRDAPMLEIAIHGVRALIRCPECADEPLPTAVPPLPELGVLVVDDATIDTLPRRGWFGEDT